MHIRSLRLKRPLASSATFGLPSNNTAPNWWSDPGLRCLTGWLVVVFLSQLCTGFDATLTANFQSFESWTADMGHPSSSRLGLITSMYFIGTLAGSIPGSMVADRWGRKIGLISGQLFTICGAGFQAGSHGSSQYLAARFILGFGIAFTTCSAPALLSELAHPRMRGMISSLFNPFWYVGSIIAAWTCFGTSHMPVTDSWAWRIPSLMQGIFPAISVCFVCFMPESPRFLVHKGRHGEAHNVLAKYHANNDLDDPLVLQELAQVQAGLARDEESIKWSHILATKQNRMRIFIVTTMTLSTVWSGQGILTYYFSPILTSIGITSTPQQTGINGGLNITNLVASVAGAFIAERIGRRPLWIFTFIAMIIANIPFTALSATYLKTGNQDAAYGVVVFLFFYDAVYNIACNPLLYTYPTEILPYHLRSKGLAIKSVVAQCALIVNQYVNPIALSAIGWKYYIVYIGLNLLWLTLVYMFFPETKGYTLEELAMLFDDSKVVDGFDIQDELGVETAAVDIQEKK
ncbi:general substrate transporter [Aspergillus californicus]